MAARPPHDDSCKSGRRVFKGYRYVAVDEAVSSPAKVCVLARV